MINKLNEKTKEQRYWIGEVYGRYITTVVIPASSRKEAEVILRSDRGIVEGIDTRHEERSCKVLREDK